MKLRHSDVTSVLRGYHVSVKFKKKTFSRINPEKMLKS